MILVRNIRLPLSAAEPQAFEKALHTLRVPRSKVEHTGVAKLSVDARHGQPDRDRGVEMCPRIGARDQHAAHHGQAPRDCDYGPSAVKTFRLFQYRRCGDPVAPPDRPPVPAAAPSPPGTYSPPQRW